MAVPQEKLDWTVEEYLEFEKTSDVRHEYVDGQIYAMAGERKRHNKLAGRLFNRLSAHLEDTDCDVYFESIKLFTSQRKYYYPDVVVSCDDTTDDELSVVNPVLIIEVLSPTTARVDRAEKMLAYQKIASLREYVLVSSERVWVQIYRRTGGEDWSVEQFLDLKETIKFDSVNLTMHIADVYRKINFTAENVD